MTKQISLNALWDSAISKEQAFGSDRLSHLPEAARRYLEHAIAPGTAIASAVRLQMHGEIKLKSWIPFKAEQVICWERGLIWSATAWMNGLPIVGSDRLVDGVGAMQWKLLGIFPVMIASGCDITRSGVGRLQAEATWLPSVFCGDEVSWTRMDSSHLHSSFVVQDQRAELDFTIEQTGRLKTVKLPRWGNPEGAEFHDVDFGAIVESEVHSVATPFRTVCGLDGTSALIGLSRRANFSESQSMMQSIGRLIKLKEYVTTSVLGSSLQLI